ncbi:MAG: hypothetical protein BGO54_02020 [Sphingobacteriales bacterium 46-32]|nr:MAG: hypothetical protein BGO54_02020 [Sphingobacteriales bacterium 46-32]
MISMSTRLSLTSFIFAFFTVAYGQNSRPLNDILNQISTQWKLDSNSCNGYRCSVWKKLLHVKTDYVSKDAILLKLGNPNRIQKLYKGSTNKNYVSYTYYVYKDACPNIDVDGIAIEFVFDELEQFLLEITEVFYCG